MAAEAKSLPATDLTQFDLHKPYDQTSPTYTSKILKHKVTGKYVHVKVFPKAKNQAANEYKVLKYLSAAKSPHIITPISLTTDLAAPNVHVLQCDALTGDEFFDYVGNGAVSEDVAKQWFRQLALGLATIHRFGVAHRDVKPENIIKTTDALDSPLAFLNFEFSVYAADDQDVKDLPATPHYVAPEVLGGNVVRRNGRTWRASDMWSMGVMLYQALTNVFPFDATDAATGAVNQQLLLEKVRDGVFAYPDDGPNLSGAAKDLIASLLEKDLNKRLSADQMIKHPWFASLGPAPSVPAPPAGHAFTTPHTTPRSSITGASAQAIPSAALLQAAAAAAAAPSGGYSLPPIVESAAPAAAPAAAAAAPVTLPPVAAAPIAAAPAPAAAAAVDVKAAAPAEQPKPAVVIHSIPSPGHPNPALIRRTVASVPREYKTLQELIDGNFEVQYLQDVNDASRYAMKLIKKGVTPRELKNATAKFEKEYAALKLLMHCQQDPHPNIVPLLDALEDQNQFSLIYSHSAGPDLFEVLSTGARLSEPNAAAIVRAVLGALVVCHRNNVAHRDIKPENLFYAARNADMSGAEPLRLVNFESAVIAADDDQINDLTIDLRYVAPEVLADVKRTGKSWRASDVWSTGVLLFVLLCGKLPFGGENNPDFAIQKTIIQAGVYELPTASDFKLSDEAVDLISRMLNKDWSQRITAAAALAHPWFGKFVESKAAPAAGAAADAKGGDAKDSKEAAPAAGAVDGKGKKAKKKKPEPLTPEEQKRAEDQARDLHEEALGLGFALMNDRRGWSLEAVDTVDDALVVKSETVNDMGDTISTSLRMKIYYPKETKRDAFEAEAKGLSLAHHENVCPLVELLDEEKWGGIVIPNVKENDDLFELLYKEPLREKDARPLARQVFSALSACHRAGVVHRDVKPENFIFTKNDDKDAPLLLCNFENSAVGKDDDDVGDGVVDFRFVAPEVLDSKIDPKTWTLARASDMWSAGVILFAMITAKLPFEGKTPKASLKKVIAGVFDFPLGLPLTGQVRDLVGKLLDKDVAKRLTATEVLAHPWFGDSPEEQPADPKAEAKRVAAEREKKERDEKEAAEKAARDRENEEDEKRAAQAQAVKDAPASDALALDSQPKFDFDNEKPRLTLPTYPGASIAGSEYVIVSVKSADDDPECHELVVAHPDTPHKQYLLKRYHKKGAVAQLSSVFVIANKLFGNPHPSVLSMTEQIDEYEALSILTPLPTGTDLFEILYKDPLSEEESRKLFGSVVTSLRHCHGLNIAFRDVKPENFVFRSDEKDSALVLTNFEHAIVAQDDTPVKSVVITPEFVAPEVIRDDVPRNGRTWRASDMWSAGVLLYAMLTARVPFAGNTTKAILKRVMAGVIDWPPLQPGQQRITGQAKDLVTQLLQKDWAARPSAADVLRHPWFTRPQAVGSEDDPTALALDAADAKAADGAPGAAAAAGPRDPAVVAAERKARKAREQGLQNGALVAAATCTLM